MVILIGGATHSGKTVLSQKILEKYGYPYLSIDHLKMGLIRSGNTDLTPESSDEELTDYLWPIVREIVKTAVENEQNLTVEGCYIPFDWKKDFSEEYLEDIRYCCLVMSEEYIIGHFGDILNFGNSIEKRRDNGVSIEDLIRENRSNLELSRKNGSRYILLDGIYAIDIDSVINQ